MASKTPRKLWIYRGKGDCLGYGELRAAGDYYEAMYRLLAVYPRLTRMMLEDPDRFEMSCEELPVQ